MIKGRFYTLLTLLLIGGVSFGQPPQDNKKEKRDQLHAQKVAFISTQLELTTEEAQKFWPVYNLYEAEIEATRKERRGYQRELKKSNDMGGERAYQLFILIFETEKKEADIRLTYLKKFSEVVGKEKAAKVFIAEHEFKRVLMERIKDGKNPPPPPHDHH